MVVAVAWLAAVIGAVTMVAVASSGVILAGSGFPVAFAGLALAGVSDASVGAVLTLRRPGNVIGLVLLLAAILLPVTFLGFIGGAVTEGQGSRDVLAGLSALLGSLGIVPTLIIAGPLLGSALPGWAPPRAALEVAGRSDRGDGGARFGDRGAPPGARRRQPRRQPVRPG